MFKVSLAALGRVQAAFYLTHTIDTLDAVSEKVTEQFFPRLLFWKYR